MCVEGGGSHSFLRRQVSLNCEKKSPLIPVAGKQTIVNITRTVEDFFKVVLINISHDALFLFAFFAAKKNYIKCYF